LRYLARRQLPERRSRLQIPVWAVLPLAKLQAPLKEAFSKGRSANDGTVTGYEFRNSGDTDLCLGAMTTGARAGQNRDPVRAWNCGIAANEIWIPEQWELHGSRFTWLVNDERTGTSATGIAA
jgi:hypothetical protein